MTITAAPLSRALRSPTPRSVATLELPAAEHGVRHLAIIMDGNGRWAKARNLPRLAGHKAGTDNLRRILRACKDQGIRIVTLYAFSTENWKRPRWEIRALMALLKEYLQKELTALTENNIRFRPIGRVHELEDDIQRGLARAVDATRANTGLLFQIALNYSGRAELVDLCRRLATSARAGEITPERIDEQWVSDQLETAGTPDPDLLIRTSGELRVSNFLLWQIAYTELHITPVLWPDFTAQHLIHAVADYVRRERRFGGVVEPSRDNPEENAGEG